MTRTISIPVLDFRACLLDGLTKLYEQPREGIHGSDLINCPRQVCLEKLYPSEKTEQTLMYFCSGQFQHSKLQQLLGEEFECEKEIIWKDIQFHPDVIWKPQNVIIEIKTARTDSVLRTPRPTNVDQLKMYMAVLNSPYGILQYVIMNKYENCFPTHYVTLEHDERLKILEELEVVADELRAGIELKIPGYVRHVARNPKFIQETPSGYKYNWLCKSCHHKDRCDRIREEAGEFRRQAEDVAMMKIPDAWKPKC